MRVLVLALWLPLAAQDLFLAPSEFLVSPGQRITALVSGGDSSLARLKDATLHTPKAAYNVVNLRADGAGVAGDAAIPGKGSLILTVRAAPEIVSRERRAAFAKALLVSEAGDDQFRRATGLGFEIVPESDPYLLKPGGKLPVRVLLRGKAAAGIEVRVSNDLGEARLAGRTDPGGRLAVPVPVPGVWRLHSVVRERSMETRLADWETLSTSLTFALPAEAQRGNPSMLVSTEWLSNHLSDDSLVVLHVGSRTDYDAGHIPGARLVTLGDVSITGERGLRLEMPPVAALEEAFRRVGVSDSSQIIVYPGNDSVQSATRVWFTLDYLGKSERASLLDGGLAAWKAEGRPLSREAPRSEPGGFTARPAPERIVNADWIRSHLEDRQVQVLDARLPEFYSGANAGGMPRSGHVPGARNVPFSSALDSQRKLKPAESLRELLMARPGQPPALTVTYCHIGQQATLVYFVARYLGLEARLYDGSFQDWSSRPELPVEPAQK